MDDEKIYIDADKYFAYCDTMDEIVYKANDYAPTVDELLDIVIPNIKTFCFLLIWIDETGYQTNENKESRKIIRDLLKERLVLT